MLQSTFKKLLQFASIDVTFSVNAIFRTSCYIAALADHSACLSGQCEKVTLVLVGWSPNQSSKYESSADYIRFLVNV